MHAARGLISVILAKQGERALNPSCVPPSPFSSQRGGQRGDGLQAASLHQHPAGLDLGPIRKPQDLLLQLRSCSLVPHPCAFCTHGCCAHGVCAWHFVSSLGYPIMLQCYGEGENKLFAAQHDMVGHQRGAKASHFPAPSIIPRRLRLAEPAGTAVTSCAIPARRLPWPPARLGWSRPWRRAAHRDSKLSPR